MSIFTDDTRKTLRFFDGSREITDSVILNSFSCEDLLCTDQLNFGECNSARIQFKTSTDLGLTGSRIKVEFGADSTWSTIGTYTVTYSAKKVNSTIVTVTAYDCTKEFDVDVSDWYSNVEFPCSIKNLRDSLCEYIGIEQVDRSLVNDSKTIIKSISPSKLKGRDMLYYIAQINGVFPHATDDYKLDWVSLGTAAQTIQSSYLLGPTSFEKKSYQTAEIGGVLIRSEEGDVGASYGSTTNQFIVTSNPLTYGLSAETLTGIASALYSKISNARYTPCEVGLKYIPDHVLGSKLSYDNVSFYNLGRKLKGCLNDNIICSGNEYLEEEDSLTTEIEQLRGMSNVLKNDLEGTEQRITNVEEGLEAQIIANAESVSVQIQQIQDQIDGAINTYYTDEEPTMDNYPAWDFTYNLVCDDTIACDDVGFEYSEEWYRLNAGAIAYDEVNYNTYRFAKDPDTGSWYWKSLANTDFGVAMEKIAKLEVATEGITTEVTSIETRVGNNEQSITTLDTKIDQTADSITSTVSTTYETKTDAQDTKTTLQSQITQNATSITSKVSKGDIASTINQTAQSVLIQANKINLDGYATFSNTMASVHSALAGSGTTTINGSNIKTGTISGNFIKGGEISGSNITADSTIILTSNGTRSRAIKVKNTNGTSNSYMEPSWIGIDTTGSAYCWMNTSAFQCGDSTNVANLGKADWYMYDESYTTKMRHELTPTRYTCNATIYTPTGTVSKSDRRAKNSIKELNVEESANFIYRLKPSEYKYNDAESGRIHHGLIAQEVKESMGERDWGLYVDTSIEKDSKDDYLALRYEELIADLIATVQSQNIRIKNLEEALKGEK